MFKMPGRDANLSKRLYSSALLTLSLYIQRKLLGTPPSNYRQRGLQHNNVWLLDRPCKVGGSVMDMRYLSFVLNWCVVQPLASDTLANFKE